LQCHTVRFSWKLLFDDGQHQHEIILSACSEKEEEVWRSHLTCRIIAETAYDSDERKNQDESLVITLQEMKKVGSVLFPNFSRRLSIQRAATLGPKSNLQQVIIKNTEAQKYTSNSSTSMIRSKSHMSSNNIPTLAPRRIDRSKIESNISDVWTKSTLPYPSMGGRRVDPIRASANSVMRKLSMASIASNFSKRSLSYSTLSFQRNDDGYASSSNKPTRTIRPHKAPDKRKRSVVVDFHTTPKAFLPEDFELNIKPANGSGRKSRKLALRLSMGMDLPEFEPTTPKAKTLRAAVERKPVIVAGTDTVRSLVALTMENTVDEPQEVPSIRGSSLEVIPTDPEKVVMFEERPATSSGETPTKKGIKSRKGIFRFFG
jgi:hypothetical protein